MKGYDRDWAAEGFDPEDAMTTQLPQLNEGEHLAGLCMIDGKPNHWLILLPAAPDKDLNWQGAIDWAKSVGGELPTRFESALIFANLRDKVDLDNWHWTATPYAGDERYAWMQHFYYGSQLPGHEASAYRAVAVRRVPFVGEA